MSEQRTYELGACTDIWTGDRDVQPSRLITTGLLGSIRWWFEVVVRGFAGFLFQMRNSAPAFDPELAEELAGVAREYGPLDHKAFLDRVYAEYPEFARRSVRGRPAEPTRKARQSRRQ